MLTAKDGEWNQVEGLDTGADDYLTKPFSFPVFVARVRAVAGRGARERPAQLEAGTSGWIRRRTGSGEVEVRAADGTEWDVDLDATFAVRGKTADN